MSANVIYSDLEGKNILVTGASRGIGKEIALALSEQKAHVYFTHRGNSELSEKLSSEIEQRGGKCTPISLDITNWDQLESTSKDLAKEITFHGLVNNAGISKDQLLLRLKKEDLDQIFDVNVKSAMLLTSRLSRSFLRANGASIVNVSSVVGMMGNLSQVSYSASKAALIGATKSIAKELGSKNVRANAICPGFIATDMTKDLDASKQENYVQSTPLQRMGSPREVANLTCFLLSEASSYITGEIIKIDGGLYI